MYFMYFWTTWTTQPINCFMFWALLYRNRKWFRSANANTRALVCWRRFRRKTLCNWESTRTSLRCNCNVRGTGPEIQRFQWCGFAWRATGRVQPTLTCSTCSRRKCSATCAGKMFSSRILLIPRMVSTSSCSTFSLALHRKSVRAANSFFLSSMWNTTTRRTTGAHIFICHGTSLVARNKRTTQFNNRLETIFVRPFVFTCVRSLENDTGTRVWFGIRTDEVYRTQP